MLLKFTYLAFFILYMITSLLLIPSRHLNKYKNPLYSVTVLFVFDFRGTDRKTDWYIAS